MQYVLVQVILLLQWGNYKMNQYQYIEKMNSRIIKERDGIYELQRNDGISIKGVGKQ